MPNRLQATEPTCILVEDDVAEDVDAPGLDLEHVVCLGTFLVANEEHQGTVVIKLAQIRPCILQ